MNVFISYSHQDRRFAELIAESLRSSGHTVWYDGWKIRAGDNLLAKISEGIGRSDAVIVIVSKQSLQSRWVMKEISALAFSNISGKRRRMIPVVVDKSVIPSYLSKYVYVDLTTDTEIGIQRIVQSLSDESWLSVTPFPPTAQETQDKTVPVLAEALHTGRLTLVCGAGISTDAGIPSWDGLLLRLLAIMVDRLSAQDISLESADAGEFQKRYGPSALMVGKYLKTHLGNGFLPELRNALYADSPTSCDIIDAILELAKPQRDGKPLDSIITFNFDNLLEENLTKKGIRHKPIHAEGMRCKSSELPVYHLHGLLPRKGKIPQDSGIVFSEDAYHSQFLDPFSWSNLVQLSKLSHGVCLLLGVSLTDPNLRRLLDAANRKNTARTLDHYIVKHIPDSGSDDTVDQLALLLEERDANELGLNVIWVRQYDDIPHLLHRIAQYHGA